MRKGHKKLAEAVDRALAEIAPKLREEFSEFSELEIAKAIRKRAEQGVTRAWEETPLRKAYAEARRAHEEALQKAVEESMRRRMSDPAEIKRIQEQRTRMENLRREQDERVRERQQEAEFGRKIIAAGYKLAAKQAHPDAGGSREAMTILNRARDRLKTNV